MAKLSRDGEEVTLALTGYINHIEAMNERAKIITGQALSLSASEREQLYETLLISLQDTNEEDEAHLRDEVRDRREAYKSGELSARAFEEILRERLAK